MPTIRMLSSAALAPSLEGAARELAGPVEGPDMTRYALVCVGLLVAIVGVAALLKRLFGAAVARRAAARSLQVIDVLPLGGKHRLAVVRCYDRTFLLGLGEKELSSIAELDAVIEPHAPLEPGKADQHAFSKVLSRIAPALATGRLRKEGILG